ALSQSSKTFVIRSFFFEKWLLTHVFGGSRGQKFSCKQACIGFLTFRPRHHVIIISEKIKISKQKSFFSEKQEGRF
ncbi:MAG: hypothetical protein EGR13_07955, partial [Coprococcus comes]|nr:hypothetical protein [Coprococcus comes]